MSKSKNRVTNIKPFTMELKINQYSGFELWFYTNIADDYTRQHIVKIKFEEWWLGHISGALWRVVKKRRNELCEMQDSMREDA
jgi:hypothetical protein